MDKTIILFRHGLTESNVRATAQSAHDPLAPEGQIQAEKLAVRATKLEFEHIVSSDYVRALHTAEIIKARTNRNVSISVTLREIAHPSKFLGVAHAHPDFLEYQAQKDIHWNEADWHYGDEESFSDLLTRSRRAEEELVSHPAESLLVVTHGNFLKFFTGYLIFKRQYAPSVYRHFAKSLRASNTGLSIFSSRGDGWEAITINDHAHLG